MKKVYSPFFRGYNDALGPRVNSFCLKLNSLTLYHDQFGALYGLLSLIGIGSAHPLFITAQ